MKFSIIKILKKKKIEMKNYYDKVHSFIFT
jgi:hypothetical protein